VMRHPRDAACQALVGRGSPNPLFETTKGRRTRGEILVHPAARNVPGADVLSPSWSSEGRQDARLRAAALAAPGDSGA
jgi:hypothetical protein